MWKCTTFSADFSVFCHSSLCTFLLFSAQFEQFYHAFMFFILLEYFQCFATKATFLSVTTVCIFCKILFWQLCLLPSRYSFSQNVILVFYLSPWKVPTHSIVVGVRYREFLIPCVHVESEQNETSTSSLSLRPTVLYQITHHAMSPW